MIKFFRVPVLLFLSIILALNGCGGAPAASSTTSVLTSPMAVTTSSALPSATLPLTVLSALAGNVSLLRAGSSGWTAGSQGMKLDVADSIKTDAGATASITFFDGSTIELAPLTEVKILDLAKSASGQVTTISLSQQVGQTTSRVAQLLDPASRYEVKTPAALAGVRGSVMLILVAHDGTTIVGNLEGHIYVTAQGKELSIPEGQHSEINVGQAPAPPQEGVAPPGPDVVLGYDSGTAGATLASRGYSYSVLFKPDCDKFIVREFSIYAGLYGVLDATLECNLRIKDKDLNDIWGGTIPHTAFTTQAGWFHFEIPDVEVATPFYFVIRTNSPPTYGVTVYYDTTLANGGSELFSQGTKLPLGEWPNWIDQAHCNWLIRVTGASADSRQVITRPFPVMTGLTATIAR